MYFKRIDINGFKSFAEPVTIEFQEGITCVVGPNGSGKSNISDAIRWVLGEQSPKALRGGKMEEVIFAGTASRKPKGMAEVTLVIDNSARILPIDFAEVAIRRRMFRSGEIEYSINNTQCRLRDIRELIMDTGIGVDGYSVISQGKISEIVNSKPENKRELFEEAAGITKYRAKKAESERKLESASANLDRVDDIIDEIEARIGGLKEDSEKAKEYLVLRDRYKELEINITLKNIDNIQLKNEYIKDELAEIEARIEEIKEDKAGLDAESLAGRERGSALEAEAAEMNARLMENVNEAAEIAGRAQLNEAKKETLERDKERLADEMGTLSGRLAKEKENLGSLMDGAGEADAKLGALRSEMIAGAAKAAAQAELVAKLTERSDRLKNSIFEIHRERAAKESEAAGMENLTETLSKRLEQLEAEIESSGAGIADIESALGQAEGRAAEAEESLSRLSREYAGAEAAYAEHSQKEEVLSAESQKARLRYEQLSARRKTIEEMESNYEGYNSGVRAVMKSGVKGLRGVVAELMEAPKGMEVAIETALGASMQNIVCEDDDSAKAAIRYLKDNKAGRLTFLPMKTIRGGGDRKDAAVAEAKGFMGYAVGNIRFSDDLLAIFEYLLGRVVIMDNLENAVAASKQAGGRLRFVTLDGDVINAAGAITGGAFKNRSANLLARRSEIGELARQLEGLAQEREGINSAIEGLRGDIEADRGAMKRAQAALRGKEMEKAAADSEAANLAARLAEMSERGVKWEKESAGIKSEMEKSRGMIDSLLAEIEGLKAKEAETALEAEEELKRHEDEKAAFDKLNEEVTEIRLRTAAAESEKLNADRIIERVRASIAEIEADIEARRAKLEEAGRMEAELYTGDIDIAGLLEEKENEKKGLEIRLEIIREQRAKAARLADELAAGKEELDGRLAAEQTRKYEAEIRKAKNDTLLDSMKDKLWEEFEVSYIQAIEFKKGGFVMGPAVKESREIRNRMKVLGEVNVGAIREYEAVSERYEVLTAQRADLTGAIASLRKLIEDTDKTIKENFRTNFNKVVDNFSETFRMLFGGGKGELRLEDENNPLECGIEISAQPPGKKLQNMNLLSGGEQAMTAIALMFSILKAKPTPFCILDEVDAALDDSNINRFANYLENFDETQFVLVTHQKVTMEYASALYGVTMPEEGISKILSLHIGEAETKEFAMQL
ncbi:MAG: chromosome segregation protein SMC [Clostridiales Family XIII bacterium]|nr:chromosome segregation protein SMC [Clostridiales Family XIII bacterium]